MWGAVFETDLLSAHEPGEASGDYDQEQDYDDEGRFMGRSVIQKLGTYGGFVPGIPGGGTPAATEAR
jgi:hypothetical protein